MVWVLLNAQTTNITESNFYGRINAWTSGNINSLDLFKVPVDNDQKGFCRVEINLVPLETLTNQEMMQCCMFIVQRMKN